MNNIKFYREPAFVFDLITLFVYKYDKKNVLKNLYIDNPDEIEITINSILLDSDFPKELLPFFYFRYDALSLGDDISFATRTFIYNLFNTDIEKYSFDTVIKAIDEVDIFRKMVKFYTDEDVIDIDMSPKELYQILDKTNISDSIKLYLIYFNDNKKQYVDLFKNQLIEKAGLLKAYYQQNESAVSKVIKLIEDEVVFNKICNLNKIVLDEQYKLNLSVSLLCEFVIWKAKDDLIILGYNFNDKIDEYENEIIKLDYMNIGRVISEKMRLDILNLLKRDGEKSTTELAKIYKVALPTMFYHLNMMFVARMVSTRNEGRKVYYKINNEFFIKFSDKMKNYIQREYEML